MADPLSLTTPIQDACRKLANLYGKVGLNENPLVRWLHLINDVTILAEEIRRGRSKAALTRLAVVFSRVLEFVGFYLIVRPLDGVLRLSQQSVLDPADLLTVSLRNRSAHHLAHAPREESITKWIITKYPHACGKCGRKPCHCVVTPWVFEERREKPEPFRVFSDKVEKLRQQTENWTEMTLGDICAFFSSIYKNSVYSQDAWRLSLHLNEELGEATVELNRLQLVCLVPRHAIEDELEKVFDRAAARFRQEAERIQDRQERAASLDVWTRRLEDAKSEIRTLRMGGQARQWITEFWPSVRIEGDDEALASDLALRLYFAGLISEKFKEEISDVISWISALGCKLTRDVDPLSGHESDKGLALLEALATRYSDQKEGIRVMACSWCKEETCSNGCLLRHSLRDEIVQKAMKM